MSELSSDALVAAFLDSPEARGIASARVDEIRRAALLLVETARSDLGVHPRLLDGDTLRQLLFELVARKVGPKDPTVPLVAPVARAFFSYLSGAAMVPHAYEIEQVLDEADERFAAAVHAVAPAERILGDVKTIVHRGEKVGRNDPCPCGSGRKFKQCCARLG